MEKNYKLYIKLIIFLKIIYLFTLIRLKFKLSKDEEKTKKNNEILLFISEVLMYLLLIFIFYPLRKKEIKIGKEEKEIFFILGIIGLIHTFKDGLFA